MKKTLRLTLVLSASAALLACAKSETPSAPDRPAVNSEFDSEKQALSEPWCEVSPLENEALLVSRYRLYRTWTRQKNVFKDQLWVDLKKQTVRTYLAKDPGAWESVDFSEAPDPTALQTQTELFEVLGENLKQPESSDFKPKRSLVLTDSRRASRTLFPCASYGSLFLQNPDVGPWVEWELRQSAQNLVRIKLPLKELHLRASLLETPWCAWMQDEKKKNSLVILMTRAGSLARIEINEKDSKEQTRKKLSAIPLEKPNLQGQYSLVRDAQNTLALIKIGTGGPQVYLDCADNRFATRELKRRLPDYLKGLRAKLSATQDSVGSLSLLRQFRLRTQNHPPLGLFHRG